MRQGCTAAVLAAFALWGCGPSGGGSAPMEAAMTAPVISADRGLLESEAAEARSEAPAQAGERAPTAGFFLAYSHAMQVQAPAQQVGALINAHVQACLTAGPQTCQLLGSGVDGDPAVYVSGHVHLRAAPAWIEGFMGRIAADADGAGGEVRARSVSAEDLTRQIVDTEARLTALRTLRDRLQQLLASRPGRLADLLEVERELARVQGELDAVTSTLAVLRQRVDMAELTVGYQSAPQSVTQRTFEPVSEAFSGFLRRVAEGAGALITLVAVALPWALVLGLLGWGALALRRARRRRSASPPAEAG